MDYKRDEEIVSTFVIESRDHLDEIEQGVLSLENNDNKIDPPLVHEIFRAAHSIKAGANLLELRNIEALAHALEEILHKVRQGQYHLQGEDYSRLLQGIDSLNEMLDNIHFSDMVNIELLVRQISAITQE